MVQFIPTGKEFPQGCSRVHFPFMLSDSEAEQAWLIMSQMIWKATLGPVSESSYNISGVCWPICRRAPDQTNYVVWKVALKTENVNAAVFADWLAKEGTVVVYWRKSSYVAMKMVELLEVNCPKKPTEVFSFAWVMQLSMQLICP